MSSSITRRDFIQRGVAAGTGLTIAIHFGCSPRGPAGPVTTPFVPNAFLKVSTDGSVTVVCGFSEMGQGVLTAVPQLVAEELDVEWGAVRVEQAPAGEAYFNSAFGIQGTGGSTTVRASWTPLREAGARARAMLVAAAAARWGVGAGECRTENGYVLRVGSRDRLGYGELAEAAGALPVPESVTLKSPSEFRIIGRPMPRLDLADKVNGRGVFGIDVQTPGLLVATVARCPVFGGRAARWDEAAALAVPGVRHVVPISSGVAVVAEGYWAARKGRDALAVQWAEGANARQSSERISADFAALVRRPGVQVRREGAGAAPQQGTSIEAVYEVPFLAHACMEPMNATAHVEADRVTIWAPIQFQAAPSAEVFGGGARELGSMIGGVPPERVTVHTTYLGGGFGRRFFLDFVAEALQCSKLTGAPVKVVWSREDDIRHDFYRPAAMAWFRATVANGRPVSWVNRVACPAILPAARGRVDDASVEGLADFPYAVPNVLVEAHNPQLGIPTGFWRSVGSSQNAFFSECFVDELAHAAGADPFEFRRGLLDAHPRHKRVLELAAERAGWGRPLAAGRARGIAVAASFGSYVAEVAEVSLENGVPRVHRVVVAIDCGPVVNPDIVAAQMESGVVYGLTAALYGKVTIAEGRAVEGNFDTYRMLRISQMPVVETHIVPSTDSQGGVGEPGTPPIAPAVVNALAALTGQRIRRLPLVE
jgi:isoquinoline 1-oxidoreductase beta subunit